MKQRGRRRDGAHGLLAAVYALFQRERSVKNARELQQKTASGERDAPEKDDEIICAACHRPITHVRERISVNGRHEHVFANPHGYIYQIGCFAAAPGCVLIGQAESFFSWFPGYSWQIALCGQCGTLLGWAYRSAESGFYGLILEKLRVLHER